MPTTPNGTLIWRSNKPFSKVRSAKTSPNGSVKLAILLTPAAISSIRFSVNRNLSNNDSEIPAACAAFKSI